MSFQFPSLGLTSKALVLGAVLLASACGPTANNGSGKAASKFETVTDFPVGSKEAKVVMVEYASITCPHCANFHMTVLPTIKEKYITPGKVRYVFREFPTPPTELAMAGHLVARCAGGDKRDQVIDTLMRQQGDLVTQAQGPTGAKQAFLNIALSVGMNESQFDACMKNEEQLKTLVDVRDGGIEAGVTGTPTIFINGEKFEGPAGREATPEDISKALDAALAKAK
jgi:protein-disulfide isomerase